MKNLPDLVSILHQGGLKSTPLRMALLDIFLKNHSPLSVEELTLRLSRVEFDQTSLFRCLKKFTESELIRSVDLGEGFLRYEAVCAEHGHHHHVQCTQCKKIEHLPFCVPKDVENHLIKIGYQNLTHRMDFFGLCGACS